MFGGGELNQLHTPDSTEQTFVSERAAGSAFQVLLKCLGLQSLRESSIENQIPRREFPGVRRFSTVVFG